MKLGLKLNSIMMNYFCYCSMYIYFKDIKNCMDVYKPSIFVLNVCAGKLTPGKALELN